MKIMNKWHLSQAPNKCQQQTYYTHTHAHWHKWQKTKKVRSRSTNVYMCAQPSERFRSPNKWKGFNLITVKTKSFHHLSNRRRIRTSILHPLTWPYQTHINRIICNAILGQLIYFEKKKAKKIRKRNRVKMENSDLSPKNVLKRQMFNVRQQKKRGETKPVVIWLLPPAGLPCSMCRQVNKPNKIGLNLANKKKLLLKSIYWCAFLFYVYRHRVRIECTCGTWNGTPQWWC